MFLKITGGKVVFSFVKNKFRDRVICIFWNYFLLVMVSNTTNTMN